MGKLSLFRKVERFLQKQSCVTAPIVVAVSGGPDSVALLRALAMSRACREAERGLLICAHVNHQLRGAESEADEAFVRQLCEDLRIRFGLPLDFQCARIDVAARARAQKSNLEAEARRARYDWLARVALEKGSTLVATGHTADDQAETVLHRLLRGTGLKGLRGIAMRRTLAPGVELIRPLLQVRREEVVLFLQEELQAYREDSSNRDLRFTRNRIRHDLIPYLRGNYSPDVVTVLTRLAGQASEVFANQETQARELLGRSELPRAGPWIVFDTERLAAAPEPLLREAVRLVWEREGWPMGNMDYGAWRRIGEFVRGKEPALDLPDGIRVRRRERVVLIGPAS